MAPHASDWVPHNPAISPAKWIPAILLAVVIYYVAMALLGTFLNGF